MPYSAYAPGAFDTDDDDTLSEQSVDGAEQFGALTLQQKESVTFWGKENALHKIIVGVDFGTTYTGVSWVETSGSHIKSLEDVHVIRDWPGPGREADFAWKTPSRIAYAGENGTKTDAWGFEVRPGAKGYTWMKLLLDPVLATKYDDPSLKASEGHGVLRTPRGKSAVDVCGDYLGHIAVFAYDALKQKYSSEILAISPLEFWFTVPAVWSDKAKADTLRAAEKAAKNTDIFRDANVSTFLIAEPEAAAVATISGITAGGSRLHIKPDDSILVCDCGGGTVDITTYQVIALEPRLEFREILVGTGGKCGSTYIDRLFIEWMEKKFGQAYQSLTWEKRAPASGFMKDFEGHKRDFGKSTDSSRFYEMRLSMPNVPDSENYDSEELMVKLYHNDMKRFFDPVVNRVLALIGSQLEAEQREIGTKSIKTIIMVGGFGDSKYLNDTVREWCRANYPSIRVICPNYPQAAIVRGAALSGLHNLQPSSRRARRHYGFEVGTPFDKRRHRQDQLYYSLWSGEPRAGGCITWSLGKGEVVTEKTKISTTIYHNININKTNHLEFERDVFVCELDDAPTENSDIGVHKLAKLKISLKGLDLSLFEQKERYGRRICRLKTEMVVSFGSRRGVLCFTCMIKGKEAGSVSVSFDGENSMDGTIGTENQIGESATSCIIQ